MFLGRSQDNDGVFFFLPCNLQQCNDELTETWHGLWGALTVMISVRNHVASERKGTARGRVWTAWALFLKRTLSIPLLSPDYFAMIPCFGIVTNSSGEMCGDVFPPLSVSTEHESSAPFSCPWHLTLLFSFNGGKKKKWRAGLPPSPATVVFIQ